MFKKTFKVSNSHSVAGKDKKKLKEQLLKQGFDLAIVEAFLDDKQFEGDLTTDKLQGSKVQILTRGKTPLMFTVEAGKGGSVYMPTIYLLFALEKLPALKVYLKEGVEQYIFNGADLMWPGIATLNTEDFRQYDVAVIYAKNYSDQAEVTYAPIAVGKILVGKVPEELKGKAVQVEHYLYDELWNMGPRKIPDEIKLSKQEDIQGEEGQASKEPIETQEQTDSSTVQATDLQQEEEKKSDEAPCATSGGVTIEDDSKIPAEDMDARLIEAFYRSLMESVKDSDMPMEPSDLQKDHLNLYSAIEYKLDFRHSSFKRVGKLLDLMHKKGVIDYSEVKGVNHKLITKIFRENEEFKSYQPKFSLRKSKKASAQGGASDAQGGLDTYPKVHVEEIYEPTKHLNTIIGQVKGHKLQAYYGIKECRDLVQQYVKENELDLRKGLIKVDPLLAQILNPTQINKENEVAKDVLLKQIPNYLKECYQVVRLDEDEVVKSRVKIFKGPVPHVQLKALRVANKKVTTITGLELFQIDYEELLPFLSHKCAGSATIFETIEGQKKDSFTVQVQGQHLDTIAEILFKKYKIPQKYIDTLNNVDSKKKKK